MNHSRINHFPTAPLLLLLGLVLAGCKPSTESAPGGAPAAGATIRVGEFASLTGKEAAFGQSSHKGTALAIEELNAAGGVLGRQFELLTEDNQSKAGESVTVVRKLISRDGVVAILGERPEATSPSTATFFQPFDSANFDITVPWNGSMKQMRKT